MKLIELINDLENVDEELIIFQENMEDPDSDIILAEAEEGDGGIKVVEGRTYRYLIEVFLAKEFIEDWVGSLNYKPTQEQIAKRLHDYGVNDA